VNKSAKVLVIITLAEHYHHDGLSNKRKRTGSHLN